MVEGKFLSEMVASEFEFVQKKQGREAEKELVRMYRGMTLADKVVITVDAASLPCSRLFWMVYYTCILLWVNHKKSP